jgi:hypothetical protein
VLPTGSTTWRGAGIRPSATARATSSAAVRWPMAPRGVAAPGAMTTCRRPPNRPVTAFCAVAIGNIAIVGSSHTSAPEDSSAAKFAAAGGDGGCGNRMAPAVKPAALAWTALASA